MQKAVAPARGSLSSSHPQAHPAEQREFLHHQQKLALEVDSL